MERTEHSFIKNAKERKERNVLLKRTDAQPCQKWGYERFAEVAHPKWATMSESLRSLTKNCLFAHFFANNERFAQKTDEQIPSPGTGQGCSISILSSKEYSTMYSICISYRVNSKDIPLLCLAHPLMAYVPNTATIPSSYPGDITKSLRLTFLFPFNQGWALRPFPFCPLRSFPF